MEKQKSELRGFTFEKLKQLGAEHDVRVQRRSKEELIDALCEARVGIDDAGAAAGTTNKLLEMVMEMQMEMQRQQQQQQRELQLEQQHWFEGQQARQEKWMVQQQESQKEIVREMVEHYRPETPSVVEGLRTIESVAGAPATRAKIPKATLQKFAEGDDIDSYLEMFERVATQQEWPKETWATQLAGLLSGDVLDAYTSMTSAAARSYDEVKQAVLVRYEINAESYRLRFRQATKKDGESHKAFAGRLTDQLKCWSGAAEMQLQELVLLEQSFRAWRLAERKEARVSC